MSVLETSYRIAKKDYPCDACYWVTESGLSLTDFPFSDRRLIVRALKRYRGCIMRGEAYVYERGIFDDAFYTSRGRPEIVDLCRRHDLFPDA